MEQIYFEKLSDIINRIISRSSLIICALLVLLFTNELSAQSTIYFEDFSTNTGKGLSGNTIDTAGVTNWTFDPSNRVTTSGTDHFNVTGGVFESFNTDATAGAPVYWYSNILCTSGYSNISTSVVLGRVSSNSGSGVEAFYRLHNGTTWGAWTSFGSLVSSDTPNPKTVTATALTGDSVQIRVSHWGTSSTPTYYHDDVIITATGTTSCGGPPCIPDSATINTTSTMAMCIGDLRALTGTPGSGTWSVLTGPGSIAGSNLTSIGAGTIQVVYTAGNCNLKDTVSIFSSEVPTASIVSPASNLCDNHTRTLVGSPAGGTFVVSSGPASISGNVLTPTGTGVVNISYTYSNGTCTDIATQSFTITTACPDNTYVGTWDAINFYSTAPCTWAPQDGNYIGTINHPYASVEAGVNAVDNVQNSTLVFLPDAYVGSYDYDIDGNNESCSGSSVANVFNIGAADNGLRILGVDGGCGTLIDLSEGGSSTTDFVVANGVNGLVIKDMYFKSWGQVLELVNCTNVLIENCVFDDCDHGEPAVFIDGSTNVTFKNCTFVNSLASSGFKQTEITGASNNITFSACNWSCNEDLGSEGGAVLVECTGTVNFDDCVWSGNVSSGTSGDGGAMTILGGARVNFNGGSFTKNLSEATTGSVGGGALNIKSGIVTIDGTKFYANKALANGGAILFSDKTNPLIIKNAIFESDTASGNGGAIFIQNETTVHISNSYFLKNHAAAGGAIYVNAGPEGQASAGIENLFTLSNSSITQNSSTGANAGGVHFEASDNNEDSDAVPNSDAFSITQSKIWGNVSTGSYDDITERYYWCSFCNGALVDPALNVDATSIIGEGRSISFGGGSESTIWTQGDTSHVTAGWTGTYSAAEGADIDCGIGYCALTIPASCFAASYSESSVSICDDPSATGMISGQVWIDIDQNGIQATGELGHVDVLGVIVQIYDASGYALGFTVTDTSGNYSFSGLPAGDFTIKIQNPNVDTYGSLTVQDGIGSTESTDSDAEAIINDTILSGFNLVGGQIHLSLATAETKTDLDAGFIAPQGSISGIVFHDDDDDGNSSSDPVFSGVAVSLISCGENNVCGDGDDRIVESTTTDGSGTYSFINLPLNMNYFVFFDDSVNATTTYYRINQLNASDYSAASNDSDADPTTGESLTIPLSTDISNVSDLNQGLSINPPVPLPVELISFYVKANLACQAELSWSTATEINNDRFVVLRSIDGVRFVEIGTVKGNGNSNNINTYTYTDTESVNECYYKLKQIDFDGKKEEFKILSFSENCNKPKFNISYFPNPVKDDLELSIVGSNLSRVLIELNSIQGNKLIKKSLQTSEGTLKTTLNMQPLNSGVYLLKVLHNDNIVGFYKIIKL